jgi:hypothetical protein
MGAVYELRSRRTTTNNVSSTTRGFTFADWVWLRLSMDEQGEGLSQIDWFRCLDLDLDDRLCRFDLEMALRSKCDILLAGDEAILRAECRDLNVPEGETTSKVAALNAKYDVQRAAVLADVIMAVPEVVTGNGVRRIARTDRTPNHKQGLAQSGATHTAGLGSGMAILFGMCVTMEKSRRWDGYVHFTQTTHADAHDELHTRGPI